ncbi:hypothetical protein V8G56_10055 [Gaetbulibacter aquiaggeris]|uniref:Flavodoxin-like domain-containing protein n=1 Tax=Gaetbulibacter aquiaggeris TaxID=1735373 RepID=A0ABW7MVA0_9FLAO
MSYKLKITLFILSLGVMLLVYAVWYKYEYSMDKVETVQFNSPDLDLKLLIATQGSAFKNEITSNITDHYKKDSVYIKVIDVSQLPEIDPIDFNAIVIIHTWENWKPPKEVQSFLEQNMSNQNKIVVLTTSGKGSFKIKEIDAITGESKLENTTFYANLIIKKLDDLIK